jgi:hypothetical protein
MTVTAKTTAVTNKLKTKVAHVLATAVTSFGVSLAATSSFSKSAVVAAAVAAVHTTLSNLFPHK